MFYVYTVLIPILIILSSAIINKKIWIINHLLWLLFAFWIYFLVLYFLQIYKVIDEFWVLYTLLVFLIPISILLILIKLFKLILNQNN